MPREIHIANLALDVRIAVSAKLLDGGVQRVLADEAFDDLLKKYKQPVGLMASLKESVGTPRKTKNKKPR